MNRSVPQTQRLRGSADPVDDRALRLRGCGRGRQVNGLFEERAVQRIGLVEDRQSLQSPVTHQSLDGTFPPRDEPLDQRRRMRVIPLGAHVGLLHQRPQPLEGRGKSFRIIGAHHATAPRQGHGLNHARVGQGLRAEG